MTEDVSPIEPCLLETYDPELQDLLAEVPRAAERLGGKLPAGTAASLAELVRLMNCYYSNLIEGQNTRPIDIERALHDQLDDEPSRRDLQLEASGHVRVQRDVDRMARDHALPEPASVDFIRWLTASSTRTRPTIGSSFERLGARSG